MHGRRRKKRPSGPNCAEGTRTVTLRRGDSGFGFTISGQQPCILSCIVPGSNADLAGLRPGHFLMSVNGVNVCKSPHHTVVQLIGGATVVDLTVADNYYSDTSDEECSGVGGCRVPLAARVRPRHIHKAKNRPPRSHAPTRASRLYVERENLYHCRTSKCYDVRPEHLNNIRVTSDARPDLCAVYGNASFNNSNDYPHAASTSQMEPSALLGIDSIECRVVIGYLGTIEMPKQIATSSKLQTVRSCIRKLRQEKKSSTAVLMTILPSSMTLKNCNGALLAEYACRRINYVSCMSENDYRFFGLVTAATHIDANDIFETDEDVPVEISHSCHVFTIDPKLIQHSDHVSKAAEFRITCTLDPISNHCLEFPTSADYIVNIIRLMYSLKFPNGFSGKSIENISKLAMKSNSPAGNNTFSRGRPLLLRGPRYDCAQRRQPRRRPPIRPEQNHVANSPQPGNHSEITTTSSNSDSGIGFHNDCQNLDRILVVDIVNQNLNAPIPNYESQQMQQPRPVGLNGANNFDMNDCYLSNTVPVVDEFVGTGQPLNSDGLMGEVPLFNKNVMNVSSRNDEVYPCHSRQIDDNYNVSINNDSLINIKCHTDDSSSYSSTSRYQNVKLSHYDPVYTEPEDHHYEIIKPEVEKTVNNSSSLPLNRDVVKSNKDLFDTVSNITHSMDELSVCSSKSHEMHSKYNNLKLQSSIDDILLLGSKKEVFLHPGKVNAKGRFRKRLKAISMTKQILSDKLRKREVDKDRFSMNSDCGSVGCGDSASVAAEKIGVSLGGGRGEGWKWGRELEVARSEPDLRNADRESEQPSPFRRWGSSGLAARSYRPSSLVAASDHDMFSKCNGERQERGVQGGCGAGAGGGAGRVSSWSLGLRQLLADSAGYTSFAAFLEKECSKENIEFWLECERYRKECSATLAQQIWSRFLHEKATDPVNVDSAVRRDMEVRLKDAPPDLFEKAQEQIFRLMEFDSYRRFLKSQEHSACARAELQGAPLPTTPRNNTTLKKSRSNAEERGRGVLSRFLPARDRPAPAPAPAPTPPSTPQDEPARPPLNLERLCRVTLPGAVTCVKQPGEGVSVREGIDAMLHNRGIRCPLYEVLLKGNPPRSVDLDSPMSSLCGREVCVERRVGLVLSFAQRPGLLARAPPDKTLREVVHSALRHHRRARHPGAVAVTRAGQEVPLDTRVELLENEKLQVHITPEVQSDASPENAQQFSNSSLASRLSLSSANQSSISTNQSSGSTNQSAALTNQSSAPIKHSSIKSGCPSLDEITNKVFEEVLHGKTQLILPADHSIMSENCSSQSSGAAAAAVVTRLRAGDALHPAPAPAPAPAPRSFARPRPAVRTSLAKQPSPDQPPPPLPPKPRPAPWTQDRALCVEQASASSFV